MEAADSFLSDLEPIRSRVYQMREEYARYQPAQDQQDLLCIFSDLAQEYDSTEDFCRLCVTLPKVFLDLESRLYLIGENEQELMPVCDSRQGIIFDRLPGASHLTVAQEPYSLGEVYIFPICRKQPALGGTGRETRAGNQVLGALELHPLPRASKDERFFITKFTGLIGYHLHQRLRNQQNLRHLKFINTLVMDIEHNVIVPNMYFKHIFNQLTRKIRNLHDLQTTILSLKETHGIAGEACQAVISQINDLYEDLRHHDQELRKHHAATSLFLESLFRRDHFEQGQFVLRPRKCLVEKEIILPQLERYKDRFQRRGIVVERPTDMLEEEIPLMVDVGLLAQVYANLFSNAVKYTEEITDSQGKSRKMVTYGREVIRNYFGFGKDAIKFNVFTTGRHLSPREARSIFVDGYRREQNGGQPGTGHGLSFLKQVIESHGGLVGCESTEQGNNFYFVLPLSASEGPAD